MTYLNPDPLFRLKSDGQSYILGMTRDIIAELQRRGYLVYESTQLPEISVIDGRPKLPARWGEVREGVDKRTAYYETAFGALALARWCEAEAERTAARIKELARDIGDVPSNNPFVQDYALAASLVERGWKK